MTNNEFVCWLNGYLALTDDTVLDAHQLTIIKNHANLVAAVSGELEQNIKDFIKNLDDLIVKHQQMDLSEVKQLMHGVRCKISI